MAKPYRATVAAQADYGVVVQCVDDLIEEFCEKYSRALQPGDVTIGMLRDKTGKKYQACRNFLEEAARDGRVEKIMVLDNGKWKGAYRIK